MTFVGARPGAIARSSSARALLALVVHLNFAASEYPPVRAQRAEATPPYPDSVEGFEAFFLKYESRVFGYLWRMSGDEQSAHDLTQETFLRAWQYFSRVRLYQRPDAWLFRIATNLESNHARQRRRNARALVGVFEGEMPSQNDRSREIAERDAILRALLKLSARERAALVLHSVYGLTCAEIATSLHVSGGAAKLLLWRGRERFRRMYLEAEDDV